MFNDRSKLENVLAQRAIQTASEAMATATLGANLAVSDDHTAFGAAR